MFKRVSSLIILLEFLENSDTVKWRSKTRPFLHYFADELLSAVRDSMLSVAEFRTVLETT